MKQAPPIHYAGAKQADLVVEHAITCPTCGGPWKGRAIKICRCCGRPLGRHDKYRMVPAGPGLFAIEHWDCDAPTAKKGKKP